MPEPVMLDLLLKGVQVIGIPVAITLWFLNKRRERLDLEYKAYDELDDKYIEYLKLCLAHPDLDVGDFPQGSAEPLSEEQQRRQLLIFTILVSILERAFLMYADKSKSIKEAQYAGWQAYLEDWLRRQNFRAALPAISSQFDSRFVDEVNRLAARVDVPSLGRPAS